MDLNKRQKGLVALGSFLKQYTSAKPVFNKTEENYAKQLDKAVTSALQHNGWFTKKTIFFNLRQWGQNLSTENLDHWLSAYSIKENSPKSVAIIMAGNVPLVGFHDFLSVLLSGHRALIKQSSKDRHLLPCLIQFLIEQNKEFADLIAFTDNQLKDYQAVIATGSNNTARYFEYYFSDKARIIRRNRNSIALLTGEETAEDLEKLGEDIFLYFGLGCRNVSKIFVPEGYDFTSLFKAIYSWHPIINHHKYANNYDYNKAVYLMSEHQLLENGFLLLKEDKAYSSPIACLFYEYYKNQETLHKKLEQDKDKIQCILSKNNSRGDLDFGQSQHPALTDYADGVDTLNFLTKI